MLQNSCVQKSTTRDMSILHSSRCYVFIIPHQKGALNFRDIYRIEVHQLVQGSKIMLTSNRQNRFKVYDVSTFEKIYPLTARNYILMQRWNFEKKYTTAGENIRNKYLRYHMSENNIHHSSYQICQDHSNIYFFTFRHIISNMFHQLNSSSNIFIQIL